MSQAQQSSADAESQGAGGGCKAAGAESKAAATGSSVAGVENKRLKDELFKAGTLSWSGSAGGYRRRLGNRNGETTPAPRTCAEIATVGPMNLSKTTYLVVSQVRELRVVRETITKY